MRTSAFVSSARTTLDSGIRTLLPGALLDDHMFEPCGYGGFFYGYSTRQKKGGFIEKVDPLNSEF